MMRFMKNSKKGVTLVESVFAVVILGILTIGIISLLTAGGVKIYEISQESSAYAEATQKMDLVIASISNGSTDYIQIDDTGEDTTCTLRDDIAATIGVEAVSVTPSLYDTSEGSSLKSNIRGWYLSITHRGVTVTGFASNTEGVFD